MIRRSTMEDWECILGLYETAREYMRTHGNKDQWGDSRPSEEIIRQDIKLNQSYLIVRDEKIVGVFAFLFGIDPNYEKIEDGAWLNDGSYGTIHRVASLPDEHGIMKEIVEFCQNFADNLRIDTHEDNKIMLHSVEKLGFIYCGIITVDNGTKRKAFQKQICNSTLRITAGEFMKEAIVQSSDNLVAFNEAMIRGFSEAELFSDAFIEDRCKTLEVSKKEYLEKMGPFLDRMEHVNDYEILQLLFGTEPFCQINLLTVLAYLEMKGYQGKVEAHAMDELENCSRYMKEIKLGGYIQAYLEYQRFQKAMEEDQDGHVCTEASTPAYEVLKGRHVSLRKATWLDLKDIFNNVWSQETVAEWMFWPPSLDYEKAKLRMAKTIVFQSNKFAYFVSLNSDSQAIGLAAFQEVEPGIFEECGICIAPQFQGMGLGIEVLDIMLENVFLKLQGEKFLYTHRADNEKSQKLCQHFGFKYLKTEKLTRPWDGKEDMYMRYELTKEEYTSH